MVTRGGITTNNNQNSKCDEYKKLLKIFFHSSYYDYIEIQEIMVDNQWCR
jgi:hypothetical protein